MATGQGARTTQGQTHNQIVRKSGKKKTLIKEKQTYKNQIQYVQSMRVTKTITNFVGKLRKEK